MQITVPNTLNAVPLTVTVNGVSYAFVPGETVTVPDAVALELQRMLGIRHVPPDVQAPWTDAENPGIEAKITALATRIAALEAAVPELPTLPTTDGTYTLQLVVDDKVGTMTWEAEETTQVETAAET